MKWKHRYLFYTIVLILLPFGLDMLAGCALVKRIMSNTHFDGPTWFTFLGSYLPGIMFGLIALYNTQLVREQQRIMDEMHERNRFRVGPAAKFYRWDDTGKKIGTFTIDKLINSLPKIDEKSGAKYEDGNLILFRLSDFVEKSEINNVDLTDLKITVGNIQTKEPYPKHCWKEESPNLLALYWLFEGGDSIFNQFLDNSDRKDSAYKVAVIELTVKLTLADKESFVVNIGFNLKCDGSNEEPVVVDSWSFVAKG